jgi:polysaccharide biosynthesis transport protein
MELKKLLAVARRWAWLLVVGLVVGALGGLAGSLVTKPIYQATTKVLVTRAGQDTSSDVTYLSDQQLAQTYIQLLSSKSVLDSVSKSLGYEIETDQIKTQQIGTTQLLEITVEDQDPNRAAAIANTFVTVLIEKSDELQSGRYTTMEESLQAQKSQIESQISTIQSEIDSTSIQAVEDQKTWVKSQIASLQSESSQLQQEIQASLPATPEEQTLLDEKKASLAQIQPILALYQQTLVDLTVYGQSKDTTTADSNSTLSLLKTTQNLYQQIYLSILTSLENVRLARLQNTPNIVQIDVALAPVEPIRPRTLLNILLGGMGGLILTAGGVFLKEVLDDTLKTPEEVENILNLPVIGYIAEMKYENGSAECLYVAQQPRSPVSEAFRALRTNLEFSSVDKPLKTITVTSSVPMEGKTIVAANLAAIMAQGGKQVVLLDADLRRPSVHKILGLFNNVGLSDVIRGHLNLNDVNQQIEDVKGMSVITSGSLPPNPSELLGSARMTNVLKELSSQTDVVIIDSPPSLVADSQILAAKSDGVLIVIQPGNTHRDSAKAAVAQLRSAGANIIGVVLNRIPRDRSDYYGGHQYYSPYEKKYHYYSEEGRKHRKNKSEK